MNSLYFTALYSLSYYFVHYFLLISTSYLSLLHFILGIIKDYEERITLKIRIKRWNNRRFERYMKGTDKISIKDIIILEIERFYMILEVNSK